MRHIGLILHTMRESWLHTPCLGCGGRAPHVLCPGCVDGSEYTSRFRAIPDVPTVISEGAFFLAPYAVAETPTPLARALLRFKYHGDRACGHFLRRVFSSAAGTLPRQFDIVVPVPLHRTRLHARGYNQAAWLARSGAKALGIALRPKALARTRDTPPQARATGIERRQSLEHAFRARPHLVDEKRVLLVDDVYTTGTTAAEAAEALASAGASKIGVAVLLAARRAP